MEEFKNPRKAAYDIDPIFLNRWSPRAFTEKPISDDDLHRLFEAARWAPSSNNTQPWRFVYAKRGTPEFDALADLLAPGNKVWASKAPALILVASKTTTRAPDADKDTPAYNHAFDAGAAWGFLALQATHMGLQAHAMAGFDKDRAKQALNMPDNCRPEAMVAVGTRGDKSLLPEALAAREVLSDRAPIADFVFHGAFPKK